MEVTKNKEFKELKAKAKKDEEVRISLRSSRPGEPKFYLAKKK